MIIYLYKRGLVWWYRIVYCVWVGLNSLRLLRGSCFKCGFFIKFGRILYKL